MRLACTKSAVALQQLYLIILFLSLYSAYVDFPFLGAVLLYFSVKMVLGMAAPYCTPGCS